MNEETETNNGRSQSQDAGSATERDSVLSDAEKERIRSEEQHASEEQRYRQQVRQELRGTSVWERTLAMLKVEPGISEEIASDPGATKQALVVFAMRRHWLEGVAHSRLPAAPAILTRRGAIIVLRGASCAPVRDGQPP